MNNICITAIASVALTNPNKDSHQVQSAATVHSVVAT